MAIPFFKEMRIGGYMLKQKLLGRKRYPLVLMLEPLFRCNLACAGCGKIDYPDAILNRRMSAQECWDAADECGAPMVAIPGGEPLIHKDIGEIVRQVTAPFPSTDAASSVPAPRSPYHVGRNRYRRAS